MKKTTMTLMIGAMTLASHAGECHAKVSKTFVETASAAGTFKTLTAALGAADLAGTLNGKGPFTVFAPTDEAFDKLPQGTVQNLLKPENKGKLKDILKYHVVAGKVALSDALKAGQAETLEGNLVSIGFGDGKVSVNGSTLLKADLTTSNGVIHVIDSVLLPPEPKNDIASVAKKAGQFKTLLAAVDAAGLNSVLTGKDPVTVLAPTDAAFAALPEGTVESLLEPANRDKLGEILSLHVIKGSVTAGTALNAGTAMSVNMQPLKFEIADGVFKVDGATIAKTDIKCDNGIIHVIDAVLLPSKNRPRTEEVARAQRALEDLQALDDELAAQSELVQEKRKELNTLIKKFGIPSLEDIQDNPLGLAKEKILRQNQYNQAKEAYEQARAILGEMKIKQLEARGLLKMPGNPR